MPMPNDFRAIGPLGGYFAGLEFADEREKAGLANLLTQAQTSQTNQSTDQAQQLLPLLLQQREQENQIRAKSALEAQLGMANVHKMLLTKVLLVFLLGGKHKIRLLLNQKRLVLLVKNVKVKVLA